MTTSTEFVSSAGVVATAAPAAASVRAERTPVVMVVFDEFTGTSLLDAHDRIDPVSFPNFARLVRDGRGAEIAFAVADEYQDRGIGSALAAELIVDARAVGITEIVALVSSDNRAAVALLRRIANVLDICLEGPDLSIRAAIA